MVNTNVEEKAICAVPFVRFLIAAKYRIFPTPWPIATSATAVRLTLARSMSIPPKKGDTRTETISPAIRNKTVWVSLDTLILFDTTFVEMPIKARKITANNVNTNQFIDGIITGVYQFGGVIKLHHDKCHLLVVFSWSDGSKSRPHRRLENNAM